MSPREDKREREPVTITDRRRIDPDTGQPRTPEPRVTDLDPADPLAPAVEDRLHEGEDVTAEDVTPEDEVLLGEVLLGEVAEAENLEGQPDPVAAELAERTSDLQRVSAEYANYRRRVDRDRQSVVDGAKAQVAVALVGVLDDLERARSHGDLAGPMKSVADKLVDVLTGQGLVAFGAVGDPFDPTLHEAVSHSGDGGVPVLEIVMRQGYRFGERVLRPAMVAVTEDPLPIPTESAVDPEIGEDAP